MLLYDMNQGNKQTRKGFASSITDIRQLFPDKSTLKLIFPTQQSTHITH